MHLHVITLAEDRVAGLAQASRHHWSTAPLAGDSLTAASRRALARVLLAISLASAAAVSRLDACLAEDLARPIARPDGA
jgi:hypothetical protein